MALPTLLRYRKVPVKTSVRLRRPRTGGQETPGACFGVDACVGTTPRAGRTQGDPGEHQKLSAQKAHWTVSKEQSWWKHFQGQSEATSICLYDLGPHRKVFRSNYSQFWTQGTAQWSKKPFASSLHSFHLFFKPPQVHCKTQIIIPVFMLEHLREEPYSNHSLWRWQGHLCQKATPRFSCKKEPMKLCFLLILISDEV